MKLAIYLLIAGLSAYAGAAEKITLMVSGIDKMIYLPAKLAEQLGYLKETGLDIELLSEPAGSNAETEMLSGVAQGVIGFYDHTISLQARGKLVQSVVQFTHAPGEALVISQTASATVKSPADLKNRTLGVTGLGSSTFHLTRHIVAKAGLKATDYKIVPAGAGTQFMAAMAKGAIDAGMTTEPTISWMVANGSAKILVDLRTTSAAEAVLGGPYPGACLYMPTTWVNKHKDQVRKIAGAFVKALGYIRTHSAEDIADKMPKNFHGPDRQLYIKTIEDSKPMFTADGRMPESGPATVLRVLSGSDKAVQGKSVNLANTFTNQFVTSSNP